MQTHHRLIVVALVAVLITALVPQIAAATGQVAASTLLASAITGNNVGLFTSIATRGTTVVTTYISYYDATNGDLKVARDYSLGGNWTVSPVDTAGNVGQYTALALDTNGNPHISYYDAGNGDLKYAQYVGGGGNCGFYSDWRCVSIDGGGAAGPDVGQYTALTLSSAGTEYISYFDATHSDLKLASRVSTGGNCGGGAWRCEAIDWLGTVGRFSALVLDNRGYPAISYFDATNGILKYAYVRGNSGNCGPNYTWQCEAIDSAGASGAVVGAHTALVLDSRGLLAISYYDSTNRDLKYAYVRGNSGNCGPNSTWQCDTIDTGAGGAVGRYTSLKMGAAGAQISYYDDTNADLKLAVFVGGNGNCGPGFGWRCSTIDTGGVGAVAGEYTALALLADGRPQISYYDGTNGDLKLAEKTPAGSWVFNWIDW